MAKMIPPTVHLGTISPGEHDVFAKLAADPAANDWTVLHSLDLPVHITRTMGEIDFVIVVPGIGVLCLSVKHHLEVSRSVDGIWKLGNEPPTSQGPFKKARDDMFSLKARIVTSLPFLAAIPFGFAVLFTRAIPRVPIDPVEWNCHEQIFATDFGRRALSQLVLNSLDGTRQNLGRWTDSSRPTQSDVGSIIDFLRPELEIFVPPRQRAEATVHDLKTYTDEQMLALDDADLNDRMLYAGPAGTGKTLLAIEVVRRQVNAGKKTLFLCYNRLLRDYIEKELGSCGARPSTIDALMLKLAGVTGPDETDSEFWRSTLPDVALQKVLESPDEPSWDAIVIDEAQDVLQAKYIDLLDVILKDGLHGGRWIMFGDFERQSIYTGAADWRQFARSHNASVRSLRVNCRNPKLIAKYAEILGGLKPGYSAIRRLGDGASPDLRFYTSNEEQQRLLVEVLESLHERFEWRDIVVLSAKRDQLSCACSLLDSAWQARFNPYALERNGLRHCTIHRFKGLESCAVVVTDIENLGAQERSSLLYVACTRAVDRLTILAHVGVRREIREALTQ
jgi:hypothetical protein